VLRAPLPAALLRGSVPPRGPALDDREDVVKRVDWSGVDWSQTTTTAVARQLGVTPNSVGRQRWAHAPETLGRGYTPACVDWANVDWEQSNAALAQAHKVGRDWVSRMRARHAPATMGRRGRKYVDWSAVDWSRSNGEIAAMLGVHRDVVSRNRKRRS